MSTLNQLIEKYGKDGVAPTNEAATVINRRPQTLRKWASTEQKGALRPVRINGRLAWRISDLQALLTGKEVQL